MRTQLTSDLFLVAGGSAYTKEMPRLGNAVVFAVYAPQLTGSFPVLGVVIEHKNLDETTWTQAASFQSITVPGQTKSKALKEPKQQLRLKLTLAAGNSARAFIYEPQWQP